MLLYKFLLWKDFPSGPVAKTPHFQRRGCRQAALSVFSHNPAHVPPWCSRLPRGSAPQHTVHLLGAGLQPRPYHTPTASSGLVSVGGQHMCLKEGKKKKAYMSKVVEEGFMEKVGFKLYFASTRFYKRGRR